MEIFEQLISSRVFHKSEGSLWTYTSVNGCLAVYAGGGSDLLKDPASNKEGESINEQDNAPRLMTSAPAGNFQFSAKIGVDFTKFFDGGVLLIWIDEFNWAKLCFEYAPGRGPYVISVVNHGARSDDAYAFAVKKEEIYLRISRSNNAVYFHASEDGTDWLFIRMFSLPLNENPTIGFLGQAPVSDGCSVIFSEIKITDTTLIDQHDRH